MKHIPTTLIIGLSVIVQAVTIGIAGYKIDNLQQGLAENKACDQFNTVLVSFGKQTTAGDIDKNGMVNVRDLSLVLKGLSDKGYKCQ